MSPETSYEKSIETVHEDNYESISDVYDAMIMNKGDVLFDETLAGTDNGSNRNKTAVTIQTFKAGIGSFVDWSINSEHFFG